MKTISICIPTYEMGGQGHIFLKHSFDQMCKQTFKDFNVIISDHSQDLEIKNLCDQYNPLLDIYYYKNNENRGNSSANINNAIKRADGTLIKILFQDDYLFYEKSLEDIVQHFDIQNDHWLMSACTHTHDGKTVFKPFCPKHNTIGSIWMKTVYSSPSTMTIKNEMPLLFDENLIWFMDSDYYIRCYKKFGEPALLTTINVVNRIGDHQITNTIANRALQKKEFLIVLQRYENGLQFWYYRSIGYMKDIVKHLMGKI